MVPGVTTLALSEARSGPKKNKKTKPTKFLWRPTSGAMDHGPSKISLEANVRGQSPVTSRDVFPNRENFFGGQRQGPVTGDRHVARPKKETPHPKKERGIPKKGSVPRGLTKIPTRESHFLPP